MRKISDTIARLAVLQAQHTAAHTTSDYLSGLTGFGSNPGALSVRFYLPDNLLKGSPLVVVLHGCTQTAAGYDHYSGWSKLADEEGFALLFPEQQRANNPNLCFNWFQPGDTRRDSGEALSIRQMIEAMIVTHKLDRERVFITGLSAGGAMAGAMLATYPEVFAGGAIIAGLPYASATTVPEAFDRMRGHGGPSDRDLQLALRRASDYQGPWPKISIWHGSADQTVAPSNAASIAGQWLGVHQLDEKPTYSKRSGALAKQVWCIPSGDAVIEIDMITGMGHGTPLGNDGLGNPGPYMLDVGISSTREIARFWGIAQAPAKGISSQSGSSESKQSLPVRPEAVTTVAIPNAKSSREHHAGSNATGVQKVIEDALRAAGLMR